MKWLNKKLLKLVEWFQPSYKATYVNDLPDMVGIKIIYVIGEPNNPWLLTFKCPCGCMNTIQLNLLREAKPQWKFKVLHNSKIDISPSIWRTSGCKSHFMIRKGKITWC